MLRIECSRAVVPKFHPPAAHTGECVGVMYWYFLHLAENISDTSNGLDLRKAFFKVSMEIQVEVRIWLRLCQSFTHQLPAVGGCIHQHLLVCIHQRALTSIHSGANIHQHTFTSMHSLPYIHQHTFRCMYSLAYIQENIYLPAECGYIHWHSFR